MDLMRRIGYDLIRQKEKDHATHVLAALKNIDNLTNLGDLSVDRLPTIAFVVWHNGRMLPQAFVSTLLNVCFLF